MAKYLYRTCPKCKDYLGVVVPEPPDPVTEIPIDARCLRCGFKLAWKVITGRKSIVALLWLVLFLPLNTSSVYPLGERQPQYRTVRRVVDDSTFLNAEIIKQGYGFAYTRFPFKYMDEFRRYQREAREQGRGLWGQSS